MLKLCRHCGQVISRDGADHFWVHNNGFLTCLTLSKLGEANAKFAEPEED